jgi:hypothetical protein
MRGIERRIEAGLNPAVHSVASIFISRWDKAVAGKEPDGLKNRLGIAVAMQAYKAYRDLLISPQWLQLAAKGACAQRLLWASTGTKDPKASDTLLHRRPGYTCPMHPEVQQDHPGDCPKCGMTLEPKTVTAGRMTRRTPNCAT